MGTFHLRSHRLSSQAYANHHQSLPVPEKLSLRVAADWIRTSFAFANIITPFIAVVHADSHW